MYDKAIMRECLKGIGADWQTSKPWRRTAGDARLLDDNDSPKISLRINTRELAQALYRIKSLLLC